MVCPPVGGGPVRSRSFWRRERLIWFWRLYPTLFIRTENQAVCMMPELPLAILLSRPFFAIF
jgi:hypothetical protein